MAPSKHALLGPSSSARWLACPPSARLTEFMPNETSVYAEEGTKAHYLCEQVVRRSIPGWEGLPEAPIQDLWSSDDYTPEMKEAARLYADFIHTLYAEFQHTPTVCVEQHVKMTRWVPECFGTCDCLLIGDGILHVVDFKYGAGVPVSPEENTQMMLYALGAWELFRETDEIKTVRMSIVQPRIQSEPETWEIPENDLTRWAESFLKPMAQLAWEGKGQLNPGEKQCRWCKAKAQCRAWKDKYGPLAGFVAETIPEARDPRLLTNEEIGDWLTQVQGLAEYVKCLEEYAQQQLQSGTLVPGWKLVEGRSTRRFTDQDAAFKAMEASGIQEAMLYERTPISLTAAEKLLGKKHFAEVCGGYVEKPKGAPKLAPESDKRPAYDPAEGFEVIKK